MLLEMIDRTDTITEAPEPESEGNLNDAIERIVGIVVRGRWCILTAACLTSLAVIAYAMKLPNRYVSQATLLVVQQQVSQRYVEPDSVTTTPAAVQALKMEVLSNNRLLAIINDLGLYANEKKREAPEVLIDQMRQKDIDIQPLETTAGRTDFNAITITFSASNPQLAQEVTSRLSSLFIEQNLRTQGEEAANTTRFLSEQLEAAKQRLAEQSQRLQSFKTSNLGELPEQQQANLAALTDVRERLAAVNASLLVSQQQQASAEAPINDRLSRLRSEKATLLERYTPLYPEVVKKDQEIARVQAVLDRLKAGTPSPGKTQDGDPTDDPALAGIIRQAEANVVAIANLYKEQQKLKAESEQYQTRLNLTPVREQQLSEILRDYDLFRQDYTNLLNKKLQSQMTTNLEENQEGQQFRLADPPTVPQRPSSPKRLRIALGGMGAGLALGLALAFLISTRDSSFYTEKAIARAFALPLVLGVPLVPTRAETRLRGWRIAFEWMAGCAMTLVMFAAEFYVYRKG